VVGAVAVAVAAVVAWVLPRLFFIRQPRKQTERFHMVLILMGPLSFTRLS
jgi:hypothetical protein